jgi:hypothetical protein
VKAALIATVAALAVAAAGAQAANGVYRWVGVDGVVHYSDTPPPKGAHKLNIHASAPREAATAARKKARQKTLARFRKKQQKRAKAANNARRQRRQRARACQKAQAKVQKLAGIRRVRYRGPDGEVSYLSGEKLATFKQQARQRAAKLCDQG